MSSAMSKLRELYRKKVVAGRPAPTPISLVDQLASLRNAGKVDEIVQKLVKRPPDWQLHEVLEPGLSDLDRLIFLFLLAGTALQKFRSTWWEVRQVRLAHVCYLAVREALTGGGEDLLSGGRDGLLSRLVQARDMAQVREEPP